MRVRHILSGALGLAVMAGSIAAQDTARTRTRTSDQRISISKGEVALPRVDTLYLKDTVFVTLHDVVSVPKLVVHTDTVFIPVQPPVRVPRDWYFGFYTGPTMPAGNIDRLYGNGFHFGGTLGWEPRYRLLGLRLSTDIAQISREQGYATTLVGDKTPLLYNVEGVVKIMPLNFPTWRMYGVAGANVLTFRDIATVAQQGTGVCNVDGKAGCFAPAAGWLSKTGVTMGGGVDFHVASQEMFLEARVTGLHANGAHTWFVPVSFGLRYF